MSDILAGATLRVETQVADFTFDLTPGDGPPPLLLRLLKPRVTLEKGGAVILAQAPAGDPEGHLFGLILAGIVAAAVVGAVVIIRKF